MSVVKPWLSVIMPSYCGEQWINVALDSIVMEDTAGIEVLVIDSSPTSATLDLAEKYSGRLQLRVFARPDLPSWHTKTNFGVEAAGADHLCWLGVDDVWLPGRGAAARRWINAASHAALHLCPSAIIGKKGRILGVWHCPLPVNDEVSIGSLLERLLIQNFIAAPAPVFRKDTWTRCGGLDEGLWYTADWDMWLKLAAIGPTYYHDETTIGYRIHRGSLTTAGSHDVDDFMHQMQTVLDRHLPASKGDAKQVERIARVSIKVNGALAAAAQGDLSSLVTALSALLRLGPGGISRYFRDSRLMERLSPRIRAKFTGAL